MPQSAGRLLDTSTVKRIDMHPPPSHPPRPSELRTQARCQDASAAKLANGSQVRRRNSVAERRTGFFLRMVEGSGLRVF